MRGAVLLLLAAAAGCGEGGSSAGDAGDAQPDVTADAPVEAGGDAGPDAPDLAGGFGAPTTLSDPTEAAFVPSIAAHGDEALVAWHQFGDAGARVMVSRVQGGVPGPAVEIQDPYAPALNPWVASTDAGYVVAYQANDGTRDVVRAVELDATGAVTAGPDTLSASGATGSMVHVAAAAGEEVFAWTDGVSHSFAMRGALETVAATPVGTTLQSTGSLNFPRVAMDASGRVFVAYRDGGAYSSDWDVLLVTRPSLGSFGAPVDVSKSPGLLSDDIALTMESDGTLDIVWVDQDPIVVANFEVEYATRSPAGVISAPALFGKQGSGAWTPCVASGMVSVWNDGPQASGPFFIASPASPPSPLLAPEQGRACALAREAGGALDLAYNDAQLPRRVRFAHSP